MQLAACSNAYISTGACVCDVACVSNCAMMPEATLENTNTQDKEDKAFAQCKARV